MKNLLEWSRLEWMLWRDTEVQRGHDLSIHWEYHSKEDLDELNGITKIIKEYKEG